MAARRQCQMRSSGGQSSVVLTDSAPQFGTLFFFEVLEMANRSRLTSVFLITLFFCVTSATTTTAQVWNPFAKKNAAQQYRPVVPAVAQAPINAKLPQLSIPSFPSAATNGRVAPVSFVEGTKDTLGSIGRALTLPKLKLPSFKSPLTPQANQQNPFLKPLTSGLLFGNQQAKPRKSLLPDWLTGKPAPQQPPTLQDWYARPRPQ